MKNGLDHCFTDRYIVPDENYPKSQHIIDWIGMYTPFRVIFFDTMFTNLEEVQQHLPDCCCVLVNPVTGLSKNNLLSAGL
jgi:hypothetical protein